MLEEKLSDTIKLLTNDYENKVNIILVNENIIHILILFSLYLDT
jgi:hypothetical protein